MEVAPGDLASSDPARATDAVLARIVLDMTGRRD